MPVNWLDSFLYFTFVALLMQYHISLVELVSELSAHFQLVFLDYEFLVEFVFSNQRPLRVFILFVRLNVEKFAHFLAGLGIKEVNEGLGLENESSNFFGFVLL